MAKSTLIHMKQEQYHAGQFIGNDCYKLLNSLDLLQRMDKQASAFQIFGFTDTFRKLKSVVSACFGMILNDDFAEKIEHFKNSHLDLPLCSVPPIAHTVFKHVKQFIDLKKATLGIYNEQDKESIHRIFISHWQRFKRGLIYPEYEKPLSSLCC